MIFRVINSAAVAREWGLMKRKENMTYEKMSRALRYYNDDGTMEKVPNEKLTFKFGERIMKEVLKGEK